MSPTRLRSDQETWRTFMVFAVALVFYWLTRNSPSSYDAIVRQAVAFLHGHTYLDAPSYVEVFRLNGYAYSVNPLMAAFLMMPLAAIKGVDASQRALSFIAAALAITMLWQLLGHLRLTTSARIWLCVFLGAGTCFWTETIAADQWSLPMVVATMFLIAALNEGFGRCRGPWLGALAGCAFLSRYDLFLTAPVFVGLAWWQALKREPRCDLRVAPGEALKRMMRMALLMSPGYIVALAIFAGFNEMRYGTLYDKGVSLHVIQSPAFSTAYLRSNLYTVFFQGPSCTTTFPYFHPIMYGQAVTLTSPAFVLALRAGFRRVQTWLMWAGALLASLANLFYCGTGFAQFGTRYYVKSFPFLVVLMAIGMRRPDQLTKCLVVISVLLVAFFGVWHIKEYGFG
jgi:hypothetical protein